MYEKIDRAKIGVALNSTANLMRIILSANYVIKFRAFDFSLQSRLINLFPRRVSVAFDRCFACKFLNISSLAIDCREIFIDFAKFSAYANKNAKLQRSSPSPAHFKPQLPYIRWNFIIDMQILAARWIISGFFSSAKFVQEVPEYIEHCLSAI